MHPPKGHNGREAVQALPWATVHAIVDKFEQLNPYDHRIIPGSVLNIEGINFDSDGHQRQLHGVGISAKRYALFTREGSNVKLVKAVNTAWVCTIAQLRREISHAIQHDGSAKGG